MIKALVGNNIPVADMIILSDNPVDEISNTKKIEAVTNNGQFIE